MSNIYLGFMMKPNHLWEVPHSYLVSSLNPFDNIPAKWLFNKWLNSPNNGDITTSQGGTNDYVTQHITVRSSWDPIFVSALCLRCHMEIVELHQFSHGCDCGLAVPSFLLAGSLSAGPWGEATAALGKDNRYLVCVWGESLCSHSQQLYCVVFRIIILKWFISEASPAYSDLGKLGSLQQGADTGKGRAKMKGEIICL